MKFRYALFANYAEKNHLGAVHIVAGGYDGYSFESLPVMVGSLALVVAFDVDEADLGREFDFSVFLLNPAGKVLLRGIKTEKVVAEKEFADQPMTHIVVFNLTNWTVEAPGLYRFEVYARDDKVAVVPLGIVRRPVGEGSV